jgi:hypothetical protein
MRWSIRLSQHLHPALQQPVAFQVNCELQASASPHVEGKGKRQFRPRYHPLLIMKTAAIHCTESKLSHQRAPSLHYKPLQSRQPKPPLDLWMLRSAWMPKPILQFCFGKRPSDWENPAQEACLNMYNTPICVEHVKSQMVSHDREAMLEICRRHGNLSAWPIPPTRLPF